MSGETEFSEEEEIEDEDNVTCCEGFGADECCDCMMRRGIEHCEFMCPFGGPGNRCGGKDADFCPLDALERAKKEAGLE